MRKSGILLLVILSGCAVPQTSETKEDSVAVLSDESMDVAADSVGPEISLDTLYRQIDIATKVTKPAIQKNVFYVYHKDGLDITDDGKVVGHVDYKTRIMFLEMQGELALIDFDGITGVVDIDYLLPLPVPGTDDVIDYFTSTLMLTKEPIERRSERDDQEGSFSIIDYEFENDFKVMTGSQYESGYTTVSLPGLSVKQAFLFASHFYESFEKSFDEFPNKERDEDLPEQKHILVQMVNGNVATITVGNGEGCYWEDSVLDAEGGVVMSSSGGC